MVFQGNFSRVKDLIYRLPEGCFVFVFVLFYFKRCSSFHWQRQIFRYLGAEKYLDTLPQTWFMFKYFGLKLLLEVAHNPTGLYHIIAESSSGLVSMIQWHFLCV